MFTEEQLKEKVKKAFTSAYESPKKYISITWTPKAKEVAINKDVYQLTQVLFICTDENRRNSTIIGSDDGYFHLICRPNKHMAWIMSKKKNPISYHYLDICCDHTKDPTNPVVANAERENNSPIIICIAETDFKSTIVIAFIDGIYFLQSFDNEYSVTLHDVFKTLVNVCGEHKKEVDLHEQEEKKEQTNEL